MPPPLRNRLHVRPARRNRASEATIGVQRVREEYIRAIEQSVETALPRRFGVYGVALSGIDAARRLLVSAPSGWPGLELVREIGSGGITRESLTGERAEIVLLGGGAIVVDRVPPRAVFTTPAPLEDAGLVHPFLAPVCVAVSHWLGRETFHAGGLVVDGRVWAVAGDRQAGKSSTLAWLALAGHDVFSDDLLVIQGGTAFAGPRAIDLREEPARELDAGEALGRVGERERWRLPLGDVPPELPLAGWIFLEWGQGTEIAELGAAERLTRVAAQRAIRALPPRPEALLDLASLPALRLRRAPGWRSLAPAAEQLLRALRG